jgi:phage shock protein E
MIAQNEMTPRNARLGPSYDGRPVDAVIDVRSKLEFWLGHLDGAVCIPLDVVAARLPKRAKIARDAHILVYCASGARSAAAAAQLRELGYRNVTDGGGMSAAARSFTP